ncbi:MAG TPA: hypothetical protein VGJ09_11115, partial [Bryobacteraceae bacterium]
MGNDPQRELSGLAGAGLDSRAACVPADDGLRNRGSPRDGRAGGAASGAAVLLATSGIRILQIAISAGIIVLAATMSANSSVATRVGLIAVGFALLMGIGSFAHRLRRWIDRRFFREAYEADQILADLAARVRTMLETGPLL